MATRRAASAGGQPSAAAGGPSHGPAPATPPSRACPYVKVNADDPDAPAHITSSGSSSGPSVPTRVKQLELIKSEQDKRREESAKRKAKQAEQAVDQGARKRTGSQGSRNRDARPPPLPTSVATGNTDGQQLQPQQQQQQPTTASVEVPIPPGLTAQQFQQQIE